MKKEPYQQIRVVQYPCIIAGQAVDRTGIFTVDFHSDDLPLRATMLRFVGYDHLPELFEFLEEVNAAVYERETLHVHDAINLDEDEWGGTLYFPHLPILR